MVGVVPGASHSSQINQCLSDNRLQIHGAMLPALGLQCTWCTKALSP